MNFSAVEMYKALCNKDSNFEGIFVAAVKTTGIFCRPTCTARKPKFENVEFFKNTKDAMANGYRPCKTCRPMENAGTLPPGILKLIQELEKNPEEKITSWDIRKMQIEPNTVRRWFRANHGITFTAYQRMLRINNAYQKLNDGKPIIDTAFSSGYQSLSGFNDGYKKAIGENPGNAKYTDIVSMHRFTTPLGPMVACANQSGLVLLEFSDRPMLETELKDIRQRLKANIIFGKNKLFDAVEEQLEEYFKGNRKTFDIPLLSPGTEFQQKVWNALMKIPYGRTVSYKQQSIAIGQPDAVRAVARANGANRIAIIIPCHRVIGENGTLTGYGGGLGRKQFLLDLESGRRGFDFI
jgi:AraC family transcriptional regulator, regulatory protein of adaptative response / methylated-DNA-[protein]-cysteine methyltransferase